MNIKPRGLWLALLLGVLFATPAAAADKPFAEHKVVLQISDGDPFKQTLVLNVANNIVKAYGADKVDVQVVAFGPGLRLLFADNANQQRIGSLVDNADVKFHACKNTIANMGRLLGQPPTINGVATTDSGGVTRILALRKQGYELIKP
jgi:intracellular sulfur oxidation DsrE/DsrF family protein